MNYFFHSFDPHHDNIMIVESTLLLPNAGRLTHHDNIKLAESTLPLPNAGRLTHHNNIKFAESTLPLPNAGSGSIKLATPP